MLPLQTLPGVPRYRIKKSGRFPALFFKRIRSHPGPFNALAAAIPMGIAPVAVQSRPVLNRTYSAEIPRLDHCRHNGSAATSRIIAYQKRSHARISLSYQTAECKSFLLYFRHKFRFWPRRPYLVPGSPLSPQNSRRIFRYLLYIGRFSTGGRPKENRPS